jgi:hypothetical protein
MEKDLLDDLTDPGEPACWIALVLTGGLSLILFVIDWIFNI